MPKAEANKVLLDAEKVDAIWAANTQFKTQDVTLEQFQAAMKACKTSDEEVEAKRRELTALLNQRNTANKTLKKMTSQVLSGIRGFFGPDSNEYEQAGGTRRSERKKPTHKKKA